MKKIVNLIIILVFVFTGLLTVTTLLYSQENKDDILDKWWDEEEKSNFEIYKCDIKSSKSGTKKEDLMGDDYEKDDNGDYYCAKIVWLKEPYEDDGITPKKDTENVKPELRDRDVLDLTFMWGFEFKEVKRNGEYLYDKGKIYNPNDGNTYDSEMFYNPDKPEEIKVSGFVWIIFKFSKTQTWKRMG